MLGRIMKDGTGRGKNRDKWTDPCEIRASLDKKPREIPIGGRLMLKKTKLGGGVQGAGSEVFGWDI